MTNTDMILVLTVLPHKIYLQEGGLLPQVLADNVQAEHVSVYTWDKCILVSPG